MPVVSVLIKPTSSACNMACRHCFYRDISQNRESAFEGMLSLEKMEQIVKAALEYAEGSCTFAFQGGEPTLAGLDFSRQLLAIEGRYAKPGVAINHSIQTNGYAIDTKWAVFFAENHFLVGLSLDGPADLHNRNRLDLLGKGSWNRVMNAVRLFETHGVSYNVLCVVTGQNARSIQRIYQFYKKQGFRWLQFIPCLEPLGQERGMEQYNLSAESYGDFLIRLFDLWLADLRQGHYISIRQFDNWFSILMGRSPEVYSMGCCSIQFVIEGDGGVYPCNFYVLDQWCLGTIEQNSFAEMQAGSAAEAFVKVSRRIPNTCKNCEGYALCRNGCRRDRIVLPDGYIDQNYYCKAYRRFFSERGRDLAAALHLILRLR